METIKKIINIVVMVYLVAAVLIYLDVLNIGQGNPGFYTTFFITGGIILLVELLVENIYIMVLKRSTAQSVHKINELKANLYDQKQELQDIKNKQAEAAAVTPAPAVAPAPEPLTVPVNKAFRDPAADQVIITHGPVPGSSAPINPAPENRPTRNSDTDSF